MMRNQREGIYMYSVTERTLGIAADGDTFRYVADDDPSFNECGFVVKAYVCFDSKKRSKDEQELKASLMDKVNELSGRKFHDPVKALAKKTGWMSKYLDYELDAEGRMTVTYKSNAMTFFRNRAGMFVMLTPSSRWESTMAAYDARENMERAFAIFKNELDGVRGAHRRPGARPRSAADKVPSTNDQSEDAHHRRLE